MARSFDEPLSHVPGRTVSEWMATNDNNEKQAIINDLAGTLDLGLRKFADLIRDLQPYLSDDATLIIAGQGMEVLSLILCRIQVTPPRPDVHLLVEYLCDRLENRHEVLNYRAGIKATATSLLALIRMTSKFIKGDASSVLKAIFAVTQNGVLKDQKASTRLELLRVVDFLLRDPGYSQNALAVIGRTKIIQGLVSLTEFEKDPSCLSVLFQLYATIGREWSVDVEECNIMWESFIRYYPITLKESLTRDPNTPGPKQLKEELLQCFTSNENFAKEAFQRLLELMDTSTDLSASNKKDVLETLKHCAKDYKFSTVKYWAPKIWDSLKFEVWNGENDEFIQGSLDVIHQMVTSITYQCYDSAGSTSPDLSFVVSIIQECTKRLQDSNGKYFETTGRIMHTIASSSISAFADVVNRFLPTVFVIEQEAKSKSEQKDLLKILNWILKARLDIQVSGRREIERGNETDLKSLELFKDSFHEIFRAALFSEGMPNDTSYRCATIEGLARLVRIPGLLSRTDHCEIAKELAEIAGDAQLSDVVHEAAVAALRTISIHDPDLFTSTILPRIFSTLPSSVSNDADHRQTQPVATFFALDTLTQIACIETCRASEDKEASVEKRYRFKYRNFEEFQSRLLSQIGAGTQENKDRDDGASLSKNQSGYTILAASYRALELFDNALDKDLESESNGNLSEQQALASYHPYFSIVFALYRRILAFVAENPAKASEGSYIGVRSVQVVNSGVSETCEHFDDVYVWLVGKIATLALRSNRTTQENNFVKTYVTTSTKGTSNIWRLFIDSIPDDPQIDKTQHDMRHGGVSKYLANYLSLALVAGLRKEDLELLVVEPTQLAEDMIRAAVSLETQNASSLGRTAMLWFIQLLINKFGADTTRLVSVIKEITEDASSRCEDKQASYIFQTLSYMAAATLANLDKNTKQLIDFMIMNITQPRHGRAVAKSFRVLLAPSEMITKQNFCTVRPLRKGRLWSLTVNILIAKIKEHNDEPQIRDNFLIALASVLTGMDAGMLADNAEQILPYLLKALEVPDLETEGFCLRVILGLISADSCRHVIETYVSSIVSRITLCARQIDVSESAVPIASRGVALDVIRALADHLKASSILRYRNRMLKDLDAVLNDPHREVRHLAGLCKMAWFNVADG